MEKQFFNINKNKRESYIKFFYFKIILVIIINYYNTFAQLSPGDLTTAHASLEGLSNCTSCHELGEKVDNKLCLDCHTEIKSLLNTKSGYHSNPEVAKRDCYSCHSEHHGRKFRIVNFDPKSFNHSKSGYQLTGKHKNTKCESCHQPKFISDPELKKRNGTYLGLNANCFSCHEDYHQKTLGDNCSNCHNTTAFKPVDNFDHNNARFKLSGSHVNVSCIKCHKKGEKNGKEYQAFKNISFSTCAACHKDVHEGRLGADCKSCHVTTSFMLIHGKKFDHNKTDFPLVGKHELVSCNNCHNKNLNKTLDTYKCTDCHDDYHKGEFTFEDGLMNCSNCHNEFGFRPSEFTLERHNELKFKLNGAHLAIPCQSCHLKEKSWVFRKIGTTCADCHNNIHGESLKTEFLPNGNCEECHNIEIWNTINFDPDRTKFNLEKKHAQLTWIACHRKEDDGSEKLLFNTLDGKCLSCHIDFHRGQFASYGETGCIKCHSPESWKADNFDHNATRFSLKGAHQKVDCYKCHPTIERDGYKFIKYKIEEFKCAACHS